MKQTIIMLLLLWPVTALFSQEVFQPGIVKGKNVTYHVSIGRVVSFNIYIKNMANDTTVRFMGYNNDFQSQFAVFFIYPFHVRQFRPTRGAPRGPEVDEFQFGLDPVEGNRVPSAVNPMKSTGTAPTSTRLNCSICRAMTCPWRQFLAFSPKLSYTVFREV